MKSVLDENQNLKVKLSRYTDQEKLQADGNFGVKS
jgi:hypothetical protein